jgi:UPF0755 protein
MTRIGLEQQPAPRSSRRQAARRRRRRDRRRSAFAVLISVALLVGLVGGVYYGGRKLIGNMFTGPADFAGEGSGQALVEVLPGDTVRDIGKSLEEAGVVRSSAAFVEASRDEARATSIQPGFYQLRKQMRAAAALALLLDPASVVKNPVTIPEGKRLSEQLAILSKASKIPVKEFAAVATDPAGLGLPDYAKNRLEGFLFPATYDVPPNATPESLLTEAIQRFDQSAATVDLEGRAKAVGRSPYEVVVIASLIQAEVPEKDFGKVSRVIYNRLAKDMRLDIDATVNYAVGRSGLDLTEDDLGVESPYNTRRVKGLPPGPINSPGEAALEAALTPESGDWIYYVTVNPKTRETRFTADYDEFLRWKAEYRANG